MVAGILGGGVKPTWNVWLQMFFQINLRKFLGTKQTITRSRSNKWAWCELRQLKTTCDLFEGLITKQLPGKNFKQARKTGNPSSRHECFHIAWVSLYHLEPYKWGSQLHVVGEWFGNGLVYLYIYIHVPLQEIGNSFYHSERHKNWKNTNKKEAIIQEMPKKLQVDGTMLSITLQIMLH